MGAAFKVFQACGDHRYPSTIFIEDLAEEVKRWRSHGDEVMLCIGANQDVYTGKLATRLSKQDIQLSCLMEPALGTRVPNSHFRGKGKISTIFGTPGLVEGHTMCYPHWYGVGDHRIFLLEISAASLFGGEYPSIMRPTWHALTCKIARIRRKYCKTMEKLVNEHNMTDKLNCIEDQAETSSTSVIQRMHDKWDVELGQFMQHSERSCTKLKSCALEYSPTVGQWSVYSQVDSLLA